MYVADRLLIGSTAACNQSTLSPARSLVPVACMSIIVSFASRVVESL